jgi:hypothetical protein
MTSLNARQYTCIMPIPASIDVDQERASQIAARTCRLLEARLHDRSRCWAGTGTVCMSGATPTASGSEPRVERVGWQTALFTADACSSRSPVSWCDASAASTARSIPEPPQIAFDCTCSARRTASTALGAHPCVVDQRHLLRHLAPNAERVSVVRFQLLGRPPPSVGARRQRSMSRAGAGALYA